MYRKILFLVLSFSFLFAACGDDDSSSSGEAPANAPKITSVETFDDLEPCTKQLQGRVFFIENEQLYVVCVDDDWFDVDSSMLEDVLSGKLPDTSDSLEGEFVMPENVDSSEVAKLPTIKVESVTVTGFAHKGPFASGTSVTLFGLNRRFEKTKTRFTTRIENDRGAFTIENVSLESQYALVQVYGFFKSEVSGQKTSGTRTKLSAIVDLSAGGIVNVNVNLFTDLEYARVKQLVKRGKFNVPAAKARATKEILSFFGVNAADKPTATDIALSKADESAKALYIASVLFLGDLEMGSLWYRLEGMEKRFALKGNLDSAQFRAELADWACRADSLDGYASIRENIESMNLANAVPDFETFIRNFWVAEFGLGKCSSSNEMKNAKNENVYSATFGEPYVCSSNRWRRTSQLDVELGFCFSLKNGTYKEKAGENGTEYFVCKNGAWHSISAADYEFKECTAEREHEIVATKSMEYFTCRKGKWIGTDAISYQLGECTALRNSLVGKISASAAYVCEWYGNAGGWREASEVEAEYGVCGRDRNDGHVYRTKGGNFFRCDGAMWQKSDWLTYEKQNAGACTDRKFHALYMTDDHGLLVCEDGEWREASPVESQFGMCDASKQDTMVWTGAFYANGLGKIPDESAGGDGAYFRCNNDTWERSDKLHYVYGVTCKTSFASRYGTRRMSNDGYMDSENNTFLKEWFFGGERMSPEDERIYSGLFSIDGEDYSYVLCKDDSWQKISALDFAARKVCADSVYDRRLQGKDEEGYPIDQYFKCTESGWVSIPEWQAVECGPENQGDTLRTTSVGKYVCLSFGGEYQWRETFVDERDGTTYRIAKIGNQTWMADNLNYRYTEPTKSMDSSSLCFKNNLANCKKYGRLYFWSAAIDSTKIASYGYSYCGYGTSCNFENGVQGVCPDGWRLPSQTDYDELDDYVKSCSYDLQAKGYPAWPNATDAYGFSARPAGFYAISSATKFGFQDSTVLYWSSLERDEDFAYRLAVTSSASTVMGAISKEMAISVRCIKD